LFGAHLSVAGGLHNAVTAATALGCETVQLFTKNANQWRGKPLAEDEIRTFREALVAAGLKLPTAHDSYLINLASPKDAAYRQSIEAFVDELQRAELLGLNYLVMHPGAHTGSGEAAGLFRVVAALDEIHDRCSGFHTRILLETTAGQGTTLGYRFEHLAAILQGVREPGRLGVCLDTCHVYAAGYPLDTSEDYTALFGQFDRTLGLENLKLFHINNSVKPLNSRVDRHAGLAQGLIGLEFFRRLVTDPRFSDRPMILETPKEGEEGEAMDPINLRILRGFLGGTPPGGKGGLS
jgi:deoxyribonuclease-4